jgi:phenylpropionate dioxygenase-like ring-hydroxylating dioxygenase large terminal subunit
MVATAKKYDVIDAETGRLDRRIFVDEDVYREEMEKVFGRAWVMVAHTSLVPKPHDFFLSYIGEDPVIVTRDADDKIHVMLNMCRHRGNRVVRADDGNAKSFMCTYHGWTYNSDGCLNYIPGEKEAYYSEIDKSGLGLIEAKVDTYAGLIFATWDHNAPSLEAYLGDARWYLDTTFNRYDAGMIAVGPQKWIENCNWKTPVDNCSDNYHVPISHYSSILARHQISGEPLRTMQQQLENTESHHVFVNGHGLTFRVADQEDPSTSRRIRGPNQQQFQAELDEWRRSKEPEVERRLGAYRAKQLRLANHTVFPNHVLGFRLALPRGPFKTEFWHFTLVEADAPLEARIGLGVASANQNGAAGVFEQDDMDNWGQVTEASKSMIGRRYPAVLSMGAGHAGPHEEWPGRLSERYISENNQRGYYQRWMEFMNADSWADIHIDPITIKFEGTATLHG